LKAKSLGALNTYSYKDLEWVSKAQKENNGFDVIIDSAGGDDFEKLIELAAPGGRIVNFGRTAGTKASIDIRKLFWKQLTVHGTTMGTRDEFLSLLEFIESRKVKPVIDRVYEMGDVGEAFARMQEGSQFGKIVLKVAH
jgi:zinc-binding alcohol dehydrogenase/oxidoreductase